MNHDTDHPKASASKPESKDDSKSLSIQEVEKKLGYSPDGLSQAEAQKRLIQYGPNEIAEKKTNLLLKFLSYFWGPIPWMIEAAVILSAVARHWPDFGIILLLLTTTTATGRTGRSARPLLYDHSPSRRRARQQASDGATGSVD